MTEDDLREMIRERFERRGDQRRLAIEAGISAPMLSLFLGGFRPPPAKLLEHLGLERVVSYNENTACRQAGKGA